TRMNVRIAALFFLAILSATCLAAPPSTLSPNDKEAYHTVATVTQFSGETVGIAALPPPVLGAFRTLLESPHADAAFKQLLTEATTAGKLYALCGLYYTDPAFFEKAVEPFRHSNDRIETVMGCIVSGNTVGAIVEKSGPGAVRLKARTQTIKQWAEETKPKT